MDKYIKSIQTSTYPLNVLDTLSCLTNIPVIYFYKGAISTDILRDSFYKTVCYDFPILVGHLHMDRKGCAQIQVDKDNINEPDYQESSSNIHFDELQHANFNWKAMPKDLDTVPFARSSDKNGVINMINAHVITLKNGSGIALFVSMLHILMDCNGYSQFMLRWSQVFSEMSQGLNAESEDIKFRFDRSLIDETTNSVVTKDVDPAIYGSFTCSNFFSRWLSWISPVTRGRVLSVANNFNKVVSHVFSIPTEKLKNQLGLSDNDILSALVSVVLSQSFDQTDKECTMFLAVDFRYRLGNDVLVKERYTGNSLVGRAVTFATPSDHSIIELAQKVRAVVNDTDKSYISAYIDVLKGDPRCFTNPVAYFMQNPETIIISNQSRIPLYECSFGGCTPEWVTPSLLPIKTVAFVLPKKKKEEYNIYIGADEKVMDRVLKHPLWQEYAELAY